MNRGLPESAWTGDTRTITSPLFGRRTDHCRDFRPRRRSFDGESKVSDREKYETLPFSVLNAGVQLTVPLRYVDEVCNRYEVALECIIAGRLCDCDFVIGSNDAAHEDRCRSHLANSRVVLKVSKIKGATRASHCQSIRYGPVEEEFLSTCMYL